MSIARQLLKEFWLPLVVGLGWSLYANWNSVAAVKSLGDAIRSAGPLLAHFAPAFFFTSWLLSQFFRVAKQIRTENSLHALEGRLEALVGRISGETDRMIGNVTGGNSFAHLTFADRNHKVNSGHLLVMHEGIYPLYDVHARMVDLNRPMISMPRSLSELMKDDRQFDIGSATPGYVKVVEEAFLLANRDEQEFNIFFTGRNGGWTQNLRLQFRSGKWRQASRVTQSLGLEPHVEIYREIEEGYELAEGAWPPPPG